MTIIPPAVLTTVQLVGGLVASAKNARELAKASSDHALKAAVNDLYDSLIDVRVQVLDLDEENRRLKDELARRDKFIGPAPPHGYYFQDEDREHPLCPKCFQEQPPKLSFLNEAEPWNGGVRRRCKLCRSTIYEKEMNSD